MPAWLAVFLYLILFSGIARILKEISEKTQKLILKFIENFTSNRKSFAENLNLTMRQLSSQNDQSSHPIFWAPFVFVGNDRQIDKNFN